MQFYKAIKYKREVHNLCKLPRECFPFSLVINARVKCI